MKLTETSVAKLALPKGATDKIFFDDETPGFGIRIRAGGSRKYVMHYQQGGKQHRETIGRFPAWTLDNARKAARAIQVAVDKGQNPAAAKATNRAASSLLFAGVVDNYLPAREADLKGGMHAQTARYLRHYWKPLHKLHLAGIDRALVAATLQTLKKDHGPVLANRARSALSKYFTWAIGEGLCDANPVDGTNRNAETARDRVLTDAELVAIWNAAPENAFGRIVQLLMLTAQRRDEIGSLHWSEISHVNESGKALVALPGVRTKNGRPHDVPLSTLAAESLKAQPAIAGRDLVFGEGEGGFSGWSKAKAALDVACGVTGWTLHDLRRTAATRMADLGIAPHVIEALLNHISGHKAGVAGIYNRSTYAAEKRAALDLWANHLRVIVAQASGANVTPLRQKAAT